MEKLTLLSISKSEIKQIIKDRIKDEASPTFVDVDTDLAEEIYHGDLFSTLSDDDLDNKEQEHLSMLIDTTHDCDYILITE
jgi:cytoplasmic iron level regulating protein YaaA (DUF328/UPF0246 family)